MDEVESSCIATTHTSKDSSLGGLGTSFHTFLETLDLLPEAAALRNHTKAGMGKFGSRKDQS